MGRGLFYARAPALLLHECSPVAAAAGCDKAEGLPAISTSCACYAVDRSLRQRLQGAFTHSYVTFRKRQRAFQIALNDFPPIAL
ncbi:hypothetical protein EMIT0324P_60046 [Pseudomonas chlororaphis]